MNVEVIGNAAAVNETVTLISAVLLLFLFVAVVQMRSHSNRMGWFVAAIFLMIGGSASEIAGESSPAYDILQSASAGYIRSLIFYAMIAPIFALYFIETERDEGQRWDGQFWTAVHSLLAVLVVCQVLFDTEGFLMWLAFLLQYVLAVVMLLFSSKDIRASFGFILGMLFPIAAVIIGMTDNRMHFLGIGLTMLLLVVLFLYQSDMEREYLTSQAELSESKVSLLMDQIHPHFIYNSLQQIALLCDEDAAAVKPAILNFSGYLRRNLESLTNVGMIPFQKEMEHVDMFVKLAGISPSRNFEVVKQFEITDFSLPAITLQPLVENAVKYGIGMSAEGDRILIETKLEKGYIVIRVWDDGHGKKTELSTQKDHRSVGTKNVMTRLKLLCDGELSVRHMNEGTEAVIRIPAGKALGQEE